jgi:hypothetical protein
VEDKDRLIRQTGYVQLSKKCGEEWEME